MVTLRPLHRPHHSSSLSPGHACTDPPGVHIITTVGLSNRTTQLFARPPSAKCRHVRPVLNQVSSGSINPSNCLPRSPPARARPYHSSLRALHLPSSPDGATNEFEKGSLMLLSHARRSCDVISGVREIEGLGAAGGPANNWTATTLSSSTRCPQVRATPGNVFLGA